MARVRIATSPVGVANTGKNMSTNAARKIPAALIEAAGEIDGLT